MAKAKTTPSAPAAKAPAKKAPAAKRAPAAKKAPAAKEAPATRTAAKAPAKAAAKAPAPKPEPKPTIEGLKVLIMYVPDTRYLALQAQTSLTEAGAEARLRSIFYTPGFEKHKGKMYVNPELGDAAQLLADTVSDTVKVTLVPRNGLGDDAAVVWVVRT